MPLLRSLLYLVLPLSHQLTIFFPLDMKPLFHFYSPPPHAKAVFQKERNEIREPQLHHELWHKGVAATFLLCQISWLHKCADLPPEWSSLRGACMRMLIRAGDRLRADTYTYAAS